jgi:hypothetical protein
MFPLAKGAEHIYLRLHSLPSLSDSFPKLCLPRYDGLGECGMPRVVVSSGVRSTEIYPLFRDHMSG